MGPNRRQNSIKGTFVAQRPFKRQQAVRKGNTAPRKRKKRVNTGNGGGNGNGNGGSGIFAKLGAMIPGPEAIIRFAVILGIWGLVIGGGIVAYYGYGLPGKINFEVASERKPSIRVISVDGAVLAAYGDRYGNPVEVGDLPDYVGQAFVSIEDRRFYDHFGIDVLGILRATWVNLRSGGHCRKRQHNHPTIGQELVSVTRTQFWSQDRRSSFGNLVGIQIQQAANPVALSKPYLFRGGDVWH